MADHEARYNVLGEPISSCSHEPITGFFRDGCCNTGPTDTGMHTVCAVMTDDFLLSANLAGNDLSTPRPEFGFPDLELVTIGAYVPHDGRRPVKLARHQKCGWQQQTGQLFWKFVNWTT